MTPAVEHREQHRRLLVALVAAVLALVVGVGVGVDAHASTRTAEVPGSRVAAHDHIGHTVVAASEDIAPGESRRTTTDATDVAIGSRVAPNTAGLADDVVGPSVRYNRGAHYGGAQTNSPAGRALREGAEGTACPSCGRQQISGTNTAPVPEHSPSLLEHYYGGGHAMTDAQRRAYARSADAFDGTMCLTCQRSQGGSLSQLSRWYAELWGL